MVTRPFSSWKGGFWARSWTRQCRHETVMVQARSYMSDLHTQQDSADYPIVKFSPGLCSHSSSPAAWWTIVALFLLLSAAVCCSFRLTLFVAEESIFAMYVCTLVCTCLSRSGMSICTHLHSRARSGTHVSRALMIEVEDREERRLEDAEDSAAGPPQRTCFAESSAECSRRLATLRKRKQRSQCTKEGKKRTRESAKEKSTLWRVFTSQV